MDKLILQRVRNHYGFLISWKKFTLKSYASAVVEALKNLKQSEKSLMLKAPLLVGILLAGADGKIDDKERKKLGDIFLSKSRKYGSELESLYQKLSSNLNIYMIEVIHSYPKDIKDQNRELVRKLGKLNDILPKLDRDFAIKYYQSLRDVAKKVAKSSGGYFGINSVSGGEKRFIDLSMILNPGGSASSSAEGPEVVKKI